MTDAATARQQRIDELIEEADAHVIVARALEALAYVVESAELSVRAYGPTWARVEQRLRLDARAERQRARLARERVDDVREAIEARQRYSEGSTR